MTSHIVSSFTVDARAAQNGLQAVKLFEHAEQSAAGPSTPLSERLRPRRIEEVVGQAHLLSPGSLLERAIRADRVPSMILWGPPGTGKTTLAHVIAHETRARFVMFNAVMGGVPELRKIFEEATEQKTLYERRTLLFVDEIHRLNKAQQDALLPHVERGTVVLIGATTENPSFAVNAALLSRARVFRLEGISEDDLYALLLRATTDPRVPFASEGLTFDEAALRAIASHSFGDARRALEVLDVATRFVAESTRVLSTDAVSEVLSTKTLLYDKSGEEHYNVSSAFIKSMRGNDPDAAIYWMMRMLEAGDDPLFVLRRMIIFASEDVGNADPQALQVAIAADAAFRRLGMPEGMFPLAQCCTYLASVPKSNASYRAWTGAKADIEAHGALPVPLKLRNAPTSAMKEWGYGGGYRYPHDEGGHATGETYLPDALRDKRYYEPRDSGFEAKIRARLERLRRPVTSAALAEEKNASGEEKQVSGEEKKDPGED